MVPVRWELFFSGTAGAGVALETYATFSSCFGLGGLASASIVGLFLPGGAGFTVDTFILVYGAFLAFLEEMVGMAAVGVGDFFGGLVVAGSLSCSRTVSEESN